jgi:hypothetical protein
MSYLIKDYNQILLEKEAFKNIGLSGFAAKEYNLWAVDCRL